MAIQKFNAVDGFSTGLTMTNVIDSGGNISGVAGVFTGTLTGATASFSKLLTASAGLSASSVAVSGRISSTEGVTFGSGTTLMAFIPKTAANYGGLWINNGVIQVGGAAFSSGQGSWSVNPDNEVMFFAGRQEMYVNQSYQADKNAISIAIGVSHSADAIRITKQTGTLSDAYKIAGCNANGVWYGAGISAGGATFSGVVKASAGVLTDSVVPLVGLGNGGILYLNTAETTGGGGSKTWIGDVNGDNNATYITVDDVAGELFISAGGGIHLYGTIDTNSTAYFGSTVTVANGGAVLEWDGSFPIPTVLSVYNTLTEANTLTLNASGSFSSLTTSGTVTGVTGAFSKTITVNSQVVSTNARGWFL